MIDVSLITKNILNNRSPLYQGYRLMIFWAFYFLGRFPGIFLEKVNFINDILDRLHEKLSFTITHFCCFLLQGFYVNINTTLDHTIVINGNPIIHMLPGCTGLNSMFRLSFVLIFYPLTFLNKLYLLPLSLLIIFLASTVHFTLLIPIANSHPEFYVFAHNWPTRVLFYSSYFFCWLIWENWIGKTVNFGDKMHKLYSAFAKKWKLLNINTR